jgi:hypothetical protein
MRNNKIISCCENNEQSQDLSLDDMVFNPMNVVKHGLIYRALSQIYICCVNNNRVSLQLGYQPPLINNTKI